MTTGKRSGRRQPEPWVVLAMVSFFPLSCRGAPEAATAFAAWDSAGVSIVESTHPQWTDENRWRIESEPVVSIGEKDGSPEHLLYQVRGTLRLPDGTIVVADGGSREIRFFDAAGGFLRSVGGRGEGPGEYGVIRLVSLAGTDSLVVWDGLLRRGTVLSLNGTLGRTFLGPGLDMGGLEVYFTGVFADGSLLGESGRGIRPAEVDPGLIRSVMNFFRFWPPGRADTIGSFEVGEIWVGRDKSSIQMPMGFQAQWAVSGERFFYCDGRSFEVREYTSRGQLVRIVREARPAVPLTEDHVSKFIQRRTARLADPGERRRTEAALREVRFHETLPSYQELRVDAEGNLWVAPFRLPWEEQPVWTVFDDTGRLLGSLETPRSFSIHQIGGDFLLGTATDELGIERVLMLRLAKPNP